ncbi:hypothetical protein [uncultured Erythrobacter sp.]|uniref:hypothetical protein n=1 Tax=uncultured Erythrobacter sp. TaxID=263913 RepID=UPI002612F9E0|nr:hypothetical protein [uncultured Erythrobacter sp.]
MIKTMSRLMVTAAAASMVVAPIAAQANTRAGDNTPVYTSTTAQPGTARAADGEEMRGGSSVILVLFAAAAAIGGIIIAAGNESDDQSPGT